MSRCRRKLARFLTAAFTAWFLALTAGMPGLHTCCGHNGVAAQAQAKSCCGWGIPAVLSGGRSQSWLFPFKHVCSNMPTTSVKASQVAPSGSSECLACQFMSGTQSDVMMHPAAPASATPTGLTDRPGEVVLSMSNYGTLSSRSPPFSI